jgi:hypothetical protein
MFYYKSVSKNNSKMSKLFITKNNQVTNSEVKKDQENYLNEQWKNHKLKIFLNITKEVLLNSTSHGLPNILRNESIIIKIVWTVFLVASTSLCSYLCIQNILAYYNYDVTTKTRRVYESPTLFPTIAICTKQTYSTDFGLEFLKKVIQKYKYDDVFNDTVYDNQKYDVPILNFYSVNLLATAKIDSLDKHITDEQRKMFQYKLEDILIDCTFNYLPDYCEIENFYWKYDNAFSNCYYINHDKSNSEAFKYAKFSGDGYGLKFTLFMGIKDELKRINPNKGITLLIKNNSNQFESTTIELQPGVDTKIAIDRYFSTQLPKPYSNCDIDNENPKKFDSYLYNIMTKKMSIQYNQQTCLDLCYNEIAIIKCKCYDITSISPDDNPFCSINNECLNILFQEYLSNTSSEYYINTYCLPLCPLECNQTSFGITLSTTDIIPEYYSAKIQERTKSLNITNRTLSLEEIKNSMIKFSIYYESMSYTVSTESPSLDVVGLLAYIGGTLGLFLGISVLTFVEFAEIALSFIFHGVKK